MKKILIVVFFSLLSAYIANATIRIVDNHIPTPDGTYASIQLASCN